MVLLAKPNESLIEHTTNTLKVFQSVKNAYCNVPMICDVPDFWEHLFYSLFLHDFGKASVGFQDSLNKSHHWNYRHEILSASFVCSLSNIYPKEVIKAIGLCIVTHHKDINQLNSYDTFSNVNMESFKLKLNELKPNFNELISYFDLIPDLSSRYLGYKLDIPNQITIDDLINPFDEIIYEFQDDVEYGNYGLLQSNYGIYLKGFMNACDYLASGGQYKIFFLNIFYFGYYLPIEVRLLFFHYL